MSDIHLLVTCTKRKTRRPSSTLMFRSVRGREVDERANAWLHRLRMSAAEAVPLEFLYAGDLWSVVRSVAARPLANGRRLHVWVCSAGYGLLPLRARAAAYEATFTPGQPDSVIRPGDEQAPVQAGRTWWRLLSEWRGPCKGAPRTVADLVRASPDAWFFAALSKPYLAAVGADLREAVGRLNDKGRIAIISSSSSNVEGLAEHMLPGGVRLQPLVGGGRASLNVRVARMAIEKLDAEELTFPELCAYFDGLAHNQPCRPAGRGVPTSDKQVKAYIRASLRSRAGSRPTPLLVRLRAQGRACEKSRFLSLFRQVEAETHGQ